MLFLRSGIYQYRAMFFFLFSLIQIFREFIRIQIGHHMSSIETGEKQLEKERSPMSRIKTRRDISCVSLHVFCFIGWGILWEGEYQDRYVNGVFGAMFLFVSFAQPNLSPESYCCYSLYFRAFSHLRCVSFCWTFDVSVWLHNNKFFWTIAL